VSDYFDLRRIHELKELMGSEAGSIVASMLVSMTAAIEDLQAAMSAGRLDQAVQPAHACRNDALMLGASRLQQALAELEAAARQSDEPRACSALEQIRQIWPATRDGLAAVTTN
jgi:HPt (histidine-containing phosphotransfer) domain-containing protein